MALDMPIQETSLLFSSRGANFAPLERAETHHIRTSTNSIFHEPSTEALSQATFGIVC
jgi:hypothetical protein